MATEETMWSFGYGSNMDVESVMSKKGIRVLDHTPAILRDFRLSFNFRGYRHAEPAFANIKKKDGAEVHGVANQMTVSEMAKLDRMEATYKKLYVTLEAYDGKKLNSFVYIKETTWDGEEYKPSKRYLGVLIKGAKEAGLREDYINALRKLPFYSPPDDVLAMRRRRKKMEEYPEVTLEELQKHKEGDVWMSILGYVVRVVEGDQDSLSTGCAFPPYREEAWERDAGPNQLFPCTPCHGRDVTARQLLHCNQITPARHDDGGLPPYPLVKDLSEDELEYLTCWLDFLQARRSPDCVSNLGKIVGHLKEFREQQESGKTELKLAKKFEFDRMFSE